MKHMNKYNMFKWDYQANVFSQSFHLSRRACNAPCVILQINSLIIIFFIITRQHKVIKIIIISVTVTL